MEKEYALLGIVGFTIIAVYPLLAIELLFSKTSIFPFVAAAIEEIVKGLVILFFVIKAKPNKRQAILYGILAGVTFGFIENIIYAIRFIPRPDFAFVIINRFAQPFLIHIAASTLFSFMAWKKYPVLGMLLAIILHGIYNLLVISGV